MVVKRNIQEILRGNSSSGVEAERPRHRERKTPLRCVVVGGLNVDFQGFTDTRFRLGDSNPGTIHASLGGVGRNIAETLARLGLSVELITALGDGDEWNDIVERTERVGIRLSASPRVVGVPIPRYLCILERDGGLIGAVSDMRAMDNLTISHLESAIPLFEESSCIVADGNLPQPCIEWLADHYGRMGEASVGDGGEKKVDLAKQNISSHSERMKKPLLIADPVSASKAVKFRRCLSAFDIVKPNFAEAAAIADKVDLLPSIDSARAIIESLRAHSMLPRELFLSMGEKGMLVISNDIQELVELPPLILRPPQVNRSGAGDAACGTLAWAAILSRFYSDAGLSHISNLRPSLKAKLALSAAILTAASMQPTAEGLNAALLCERAGFWYPEEAETLRILAQEYASAQRFI